MGLKSGERKAEKIGSEENVSKGDVGGERGIGVWAVVEGVEPAAAGLFLKVERRWSGDLGMAGDAIDVLRRRFPLMFQLLRSDEKYRNSYFLLAVVPNIGDGFGYTHPYSFYLVRVWVN